MSIQIPVSIVAKDPRFIPQYKTAGAAGFDIRIYLGDVPEGTPPTDLPSKRLYPGETAVFPTGLFMAIPEGFELQIRPRSGLSTKGIIVTNSPGTIDSDYRGEIGIILSNISKTDFILTHGERIAQGVLAQCILAKFVETEHLPETERGSGGFGSTGKH